jgi:hypothetical protein
VLICCFLAKISSFGVYFRLANLLADQLASGGLILVCGQLNVIIICLTKSPSAWFVDICLAVSLSVKGAQACDIRLQVFWVFTQIRPVWVGDLETRQENSKF